MAADAFGRFWRSGDGSIAIQPLVITYLAICATIVVLVVNSMFLYADGSFYLLSILETQAPINFDYSRHFSHVLLQAPAALLSRREDVSIKLIEMIFSATMYLPYIISLMLCAWLTRERPHLMIFPLMSTICAGLNSSLFIVSESHLLACLFWPLLCALIRREELNPAEWATICVLALPTLRCYESMAFLGTLLAAAAAWRAWRAPRPLIKMFYGLLTVWFIAGAAIGAYWILYPRVPDNLTSFVAALVLAIYEQQTVHIMAVASLAACFLVLASLCVPPRKKGVAVTLQIAALILLAAGAVMISASPESFMPISHYRARVLNLAMPLCLGCAMIFAAGKERQASTDAWTPALWIVAAAAVAQLGAHIAIARQWSTYLAYFHEELASSIGLVPYERSRMSRDQVDGHPVARWNWQWTMPTMSLLLADDGKVRSLIDNPTSWQGWTPFDPSDANRLPQFGRYGVSWDLYRSASARRGSIKSPH